jgi:hypothetical protein
MISPAQRARLGRASWVLALGCVLLLCVPSLAAAKAKGSGTGPTINTFNVVFTASGSYSAHASDPKASDFVTGTNNVNFSWKTTWENVALLTALATAKGKGKAVIEKLNEQLEKFNESIEKDGVPNQKEALSGGWNASGEEIVPGKEGEKKQFSCSGNTIEDPAMPSLYLFATKQGGGGFSFKMAGVAAPELASWNSCLFPEGGSFMGHYYWGQFQKGMGPFSGEVTLTKKQLGERETSISVSPAHGQLPPSACAGVSGSGGWVGAEECTDTFNWSGTVKVEKPCEHIEGGHGYNLLSAAMKDALHRLFARLKSEEACFRFTVGSRTPAEQKDLYERWHEIADNSQNEPRAELEKELKEGHFAQFPKGWTAGGIAKGGPAKPGTSRHESGEAADITVRWPPEQKEDVGRYQAAATAAGLCGPPASDSVHVEMKYKKGKEKAPSCHFS